MANNTTATGSNIVGVTGVHPDNIGKGIKWNPATKQYEVALGKGLYIDNAGLIQIQSNAPTIKTFDNGTGKVVHKQVIIDYGAIVEVSGTVMLPLPPNPKEIVAQLNAGNSTLHKEFLDEVKRTQPDIDVYLPHRADTKTLGMGGVNDKTDLFYIEAVYRLKLADFGISQVLAVNATAGDVYDYRKETAWVVSDIISQQETVPIGVHTYFSQGQTSIAVSYSIKGLKA